MVNVWSIIVSSSSVTPLLKIVHHLIKKTKHVMLGCEIRGINFYIFLACSLSSRVLSSAITLYG